MFVSDPKVVVNLAGSFGDVGVAREDESWIRAGKVMVEYGMVLGDSDDDVCAHVSGDERRHLDARDYAGDCLLDCTNLK